MLANKQRIITLVISVGVITGLSACQNNSQTSGSESLRDPSVIRQITIGESTKADVTRLLGTPQTIGQSQDGDSWTYSRQNFDRHNQDTIDSAALGLSFIPGIGMAGAAVGEGATMSQPAGYKMENASAIIQFNAAGVVKGCNSTFSTFGQGSTGKDANSPREPISCSVKQVAAVAAPVAAPVLKYYTAIGNLNVRQSPNASGAVIGHLNPGQQIAATSQVSGDWVQVQLDPNTTGWVFGKNLK
jgi:hypothetical protein